jgi:hypothetical protein
LIEVHILLPQYPTFEKKNCHNTLNSEKATDVLLFLQVATQLLKEKNWSQLFYFLFLCDKQVIKPIQQSRNGSP